MQRDLKRLGSTAFDLLVIGGGIHGLATAYDAALRGLSVAVVERGDFGAATSFNHLKTIHGGLRSLQRGSLRHAREGVRERRTLARLAPHLIKPQAFLLPTTRQFARSRGLLRAALAIDRFVGRDRNTGVVAELHLPPNRLASREEVLRRFGSLVDPRITGGAIWYDYQMHQTERLTLAFAAGAAASGACLANYVEAVGPTGRPDVATRLELADLLSGERIEVVASTIVNAAGPAAGRIMAAFGAPRPFPLQQAMNIVTTREMRGLALAGSAPRGTLLLIPWRDRMVIGTWHSDRPRTPEDVSVAEEDLESFQDDIRRAFPGLSLQPDEISLVHRGVVPAVEASDGRVAQRREGIVIDHQADGIPGLVSIVGVKYTTARAMAERAVDVVCRKLGKNVTCRTADVPLPGGDVETRPLISHELFTARGPRLDPDVTRHLMDLYGTEWTRVAALTSSEPALQSRIAPDRPVIAAQLIYAVREEMAATLVDAVVRRVAIGNAEHPGEAIARACSAVLQRELGWSTERVEAELSALDRFYAPVTRPSRRIPPSRGGFGTDERAQVATEP